MHHRAIIKIKVVRNIYHLLRILKEGILMRTYVTHYFNFEYIGIYLLVSLIGLAVVIGIVLGVAKLKTRQRLQDDSLSHKAIRRINRHHQERKRSIIESFFEMVFASCTDLSVSLLCHRREDSWRIHLLAEVSGHYPVTLPLLLRYLKWMA